VIWTDIALLGFIGWTVYHIGWQAYLLVEVPILLMACGAGVWLFYIQHNFEPTYWARHEDWEFYRACMDGSSYYKLPKVLQWFTGNIGFHHIHHLSPKIPNYKLEQCLRENPVFQVKPLTIRKSLRSLSFRLWDEKRKMLVGWNALRKYKLEPQKI
jgi:omega-6 fatty acid desaturase (delta-12 desaturase)